MCGIAGIINLNNQVVDFKDIKIMTDLVNHRGPDGEGHYLRNNVAFGHRRLAILDLSEAGKQPMEIQNELSITFNGEIYNYLELKEELEKNGYEFSTKTDTEVVLKSYIFWGKNCVSKFNGMWSFAIHDIKNNIIFCSRDRFGIKPFHFFHNEKKFIFSSEIKQIIPFIGEKIKVNRQVLYDFLYLSYHHHSTETFFSGVESLAPGHNLILDLKTSTFIIEKFYELNKITFDKKYTVDNFLKMFQKKFENSIKLRLRSDVNVGTCLSGGLDSSYVAKVASRNYTNTKNFTAITAKSVDLKNDESLYAKRVVDEFKLNWEVTAPNKDDFDSVIEKVIEIQEEPFASPSIVMQYFVMKKAKDKGCIVMLDGQGGDETLLGYERYFIPYLNSLKKPYIFLREFINLSKNSKLSISKLLSYFLYFSFKKIKNKRVLSKNDFILEENKKYFNEKLSSSFLSKSNNLFELQKKEIVELQLPKLLKYEDRSSMAHSIEARVPFLDHNLLEFSVSMPSNNKIFKGWSKYVLRKSLDENKMKDIAWRKNKFGFEAPSEKWMKDRDKFVTFINNSSFMKNIVKKNYSYKNIDINSLWKLYNIAKWAEIYKVNY
tara:strand:+ start:16468 stop:18276 length:1809 start_codon:yes stop_codon:yes gene_type:complete